MNNNRNLSLFSRGLNYKLKISFYLMAILPLLVCIYLVSNYIFPNVGIKLDIVLTILVSIFIAVVGFFVVKEVFDRIISVSLEAKLMAAGDVSRTLEVRQPDEVGDLGQALNQLTQCIRSNMDELRTYSEKTTEINIEIQKRVLVLSSLLQISSLIAQNARIEDLLKIIIEKARLLADSETAYLFLWEEGQNAFSLKVADGMNSQYLLGIHIEPQDNIFVKMINTNRPFVLDSKENVVAENIKTSFYGRFRLKNALVLPIYLRGRVLGIVGIGNTREQFLYKKEDIELLDIFAKQIAIAMENDILIHRVGELEIKDTLTGLYNEAFIHNRLDEEIKRAIVYQRPCAFMLFNIDNFGEFHQSFGSLQTEAALKKVAVLIKDSVTDIDRVGRIADNEFGVVLPEKNKRRAQEIAEGIRKKIESVFNQQEDVNKRITVSAGVSENPLDGINAKELIARAKELLNLAKTQGKNRVI